MDGTDPEHKQYCVDTAKKAWTPEPKRHVYSEETKAMAKITIQE